MVVKMARENIRELLKVQTLTPGSFPVYPCLTFSTTSSWYLDMIKIIKFIILSMSLPYQRMRSSTCSPHWSWLRILYRSVTTHM